MTDWQPGDPLYKRSDNWTDHLPMLELRTDYTGPELRGSAARWPIPTPQRDLGPEEP